MLMLIYLKKKDTTDLLISLKRIVIEAVQEEMPPPTQLLETATFMQHRRERLAYFESCLKISNISKQANFSLTLKQPACTLVSLKQQINSSTLARIYLLVNQIIEDFDSSRKNRDWELYRKLVLIREQIGLIEYEQKYPRSTKLDSRFIHQQIPEKELSMVKKLLVSKRYLLSLLQHSLRLSTDSISSLSSHPQHNFSSLKRYPVIKRPARQDFCPGRLFDCLHVMRYLSSVESDIGLISLNEELSDIWFHLNSSIDQII